MPLISRLLVFSGALSALGLMTFLSVCLGYATLIIPRSVTFYTCTALLALFGVKMLYEGYNMSPDEGQEEFEEVSEELRKRDETVSCLLVLPDWQRALSMTYTQCLGNNCAYLHPYMLN